MPPRINRKYTNNKGNQSTINPFGRGFVMAALNINSLLAHFDDLKFFVLNSKIDVLAIDETKIDSSVNDNEIHLPGFEVVRNDRSVNGRSGGGVCMYLRNNINYQIRDDFCDEGVVSKETVVLRRWGSSIQKFGFINGVDNVNWPPYRDSKS